MAGTTTAKSEKKKTEKNDINQNMQTQTELHNSEIILATARDHLKSEQERCSRIDAKLNFLLVFLAALIAGFNILIPLTQLSETKRIICLILFIQLCVLILLSGLMIIIGMYPRDNKMIDESNYCDIELLKKNSKDLNCNYIATFKESITTYRENNTKKAKFLKIAFVLSIIAFIYFCVILLVKNI